jgi:hypothetical protein
VAQEESKHPRSIPRWISDKGYWVAESNVHTPTQCTIRFYNNDHVMVYSEKVEGIKLKLQKRKVKMNLKKVLESSIAGLGSKTEGK